MNTVQQAIAITCPNPDCRKDVPLETMTVRENVSVAFYYCHICGVLTVIWHAPKVGTVAVTDTDAEIGVALFQKAAKIALPKGLKLPSNLKH